MTEKENDLNLKKYLDYCVKKGILSTTFEDFVNDENKIPNIDWRKEVSAMLGWINYGKNGENRLKDALK